MELCLMSMQGPRNEDLAMHKLVHLNLITSLSCILKATHKTLTVLMLCVDLKFIEMVPIVQEFPSLELSSLEMSSQSDCRKYTLLGHKRMGFSSVCPFTDTSTCTVSFIRAEEPWWAVPAHKSSTDSIMDAWGHGGAVLHATLHSYLVKVCIKIFRGGGNIDN